MQPLHAAARPIDFDKFRLRSFVRKLTEIGEAETHDAPVTLAEVSRIAEASAKATWFKNVGVEGYEMVAAVSGSRRRLAAAFGVAPGEIAHEYNRRFAKPQPVVEVASSDAPVHQVVRRGNEVNLTKLPFHVQHEYDGAPYISAGIDYTTDPKTGRTNVGCRRLMLRSRQTMRSNLTDASDLKDSYIACLERGEKLPASFAVGSHPLDYLAATTKQPVDEFGLVGTLRGEPVPMVRGVTNGILVPADAEMIIEGYFDELGYREFEGPYGEFYGFYGGVHIDPVFHVTAITTREDVLYQTILHSGRFLSRTDSGNLASLHTEVAAWRVLRAARIEPVAIHAVPASNGREHIRVSLRNPRPGQARAAMMALFTVAPVRHVFVVNDDVDVFSDEQVEWAMASRFRADRDLVVVGDLPAFYADPTMDASGTTGKAGFDLTKPFEQVDRIDVRVAVAPVFEPRNPRFQTVRQALESGPLYFADMMRLLGSSDGREIAMELDSLREEGLTKRLDTGEWALADGAKA